MTILLKNQSLTGQISLKASWGVQKGPRGSARWQATPGPEGGLGLHPACRDALLVGRVGSSDSPPPPPPQPPPPSSFSQCSPSKRGCHRASQKLWHQSRGCTLHMKPYTQLMVTNVFSKKSQVSHISHRLTLLAVHMDTHTLTAMNMAMLADKIGENCCCWTLRFKKDCMNV